MTKRKLSPGRGNMVIQNKDMAIEDVVNMRGGDGVVIKQTIAPAEPSVHVRLFAKFTIRKGCSIGKHQHLGEVEYYYILSGEGIVTEDEGEKLVGPGDVVITGWGQSHSIRNEKDEDLVFVAVIPTEK